MSVQDRATKENRSPSYICGRAYQDGDEKICQSMTSRPVDAVVVEAFLAAVSPSGLGVAMRVLDQVEQDLIAQHRQRELQCSLRFTGHCVTQQDEPETMLIYRSAFSTAFTSWTDGFLRPASCIHIPVSASTPLTLGKSRMRERARTDLCGGRSAMVVPTATNEKLFVIDRW
jgi:hypothetical protein